MLLEQLALEEIPEVVAHHADLLLRAFGDEAAAPEKAADALLPGGVALLLPEFHLLGAVIQHHHLTDADEVVDGVRLFPHFHHDLLVADVDGDGDALKRHVQMEPRRLAAPQVFVHRLDAGPLIDAHRRQNVVGAEACVVDVQHREVGGGQAAVIRAHGGGRQNHDVTRLQPSGGVGIQAVVEQPEPLLCLLVDVGDDTLPIHGKHGVRG